MPRDQRPRERSNGRGRNLCDSAPCSTPGSSHRPSRQSDPDEDPERKSLISRSKYLACRHFRQPGRCVQNRGRRMRTSLGEQYQEPQEGRVRIARRLAIRTQTPSAHQYLDIVDHRSTARWWGRTARGQRGRSHIRWRCRRGVPSSTHPCYRCPCSTAHPPYRSGSPRCTWATGAVAVAAAVAVAVVAGPPRRSREDQCIGCRR